MPVQFVRTAGIVLLVAVFAAPIALADEVVYFTNGTFMRVLTHTVDGEMIRVTLEASASMAFPAHMVEKIESAGMRLYPLSATPQANQAFPGPPRVAAIDAPYPVTGEAQVPKRHRNETPPVAKEADPSTIYRGGWANKEPSSGDPTGIRKFNVPPGTKQVGMQIQLDEGRPHNRPRTPGRLTMKEAGADQAPAPTPADQGETPPVEPDPPEEPSEPEE